MSELVFPEGTEEAVETITRTQRKLSDADSSPDPILVGAQSFSKIPDLFQQALAFHRQNRFSEAETLYRQILEADPNHPGALHFLGMVAFARKNLEEAVRLVEQSLRLHSASSIYYNNYGVILNEIDRCEEAESAFNRAISLKTNYADAWANLGSLQTRLQKYAEAENSLRTALNLMPNHSEANLHLITFFHSTHREEEAILLAQHLLRLHPEAVKTKLKLGEIFLHAKRYDEALPLFQELANALPDRFDVRQNLGRLYMELQRFEEGKCVMKQCSLLEKSRPILQWKYLENCPAVFDDATFIEDYWSFLHQELDDLLSSSVPIDWKMSGTDAIQPPFHLSHHGKCCREIREKYAAIYKNAFTQNRPKYVPKSKIRIGFVTSSGNEDGLLRGTAGIIERLDPNRFEPLVFCFESSQQHCRRALPEERIRIVVLPRNFEQAANVMRDTACDVIYYWKVEPGTWNPFLAMTYPAPIQCTSWGTLGTSGIDAIDYYLTSPFMEPEHIDILPHYTEKVEMLATFPMFEPRTILPQNVSRAEYNLPPQGAIYFCPHRISKYHPSFDGLMKRILDCDTNGCLVLKIDSSQSTPVRHLKRRLEKNLGQSLMKRVFFFDTLSYENYRRLFSLATCVLDSPVFTGGYTAYDALSYGIPLVTRPGTIGVQTFTAGFYRKLQMPEMVTHSADQYVEMALKIGTDSDFRDAISRRILDRCDILFCEDLAVREFERFFEKAIQQELKR